MSHKEIKVKIFLYLLVGALVLWTVMSFMRKGDKMSATAVKTKIDTGALIVDVRTAGEYAGGHYPNAINIPLDQVQARISEFGGDKNREIVVYCLSGGRSASAKRILESAGYKNVTNAGGLGDMP
ncbi:MAG: rhodanese-like domain-containing protein [Leptospiraceae bacterium]|nr:rhodanese-like domain-containing protein [Leptospiraceae bacterium]